MRERQALRRTPPRTWDSGFGKPDSSDVASCAMMAGRLGIAREIVAALIGAPVAELDAERTVIEVMS